MIKLATIAGSDASGGAGLEADLKTFQEYGVYGMAAVTVIATMNPDKEWGHEVFPLDEQTIRAQLETIFKGIGVNAAKTGMLATNYAVELSAEYLKKYNVENYVLDPVMVCKGGDLALNPELNNLIIKKLLPLAKLITPNLFEAGQIAKMPTPSTIEEIKEGCEFAAKYGADIYVTANIIAHDENFEGLDEFLMALQDAGVRGIIVADPYIIERCKTVAPKVEVHISTQQSISNYKEVRYWESEGVHRVVLARETGYEEIKEINNISHISESFKLDYRICEERIKYLDS